jgi:hypothetical protein
MDVILEFSGETEKNIGHVPLEDVIQTCDSLQGSLASIEVLMDIIITSVAHKLAILTVPYIHSLRGCKKFGSPSSSIVVHLIDQTLGRAQLFYQRIMNALHS